MSSRNLENTPSFIDNLILDTGTIGNLESAAIDDGVVVSFAADVTGPMKDDVMNSMLLAQFSANARYNRQKQVEDWYASYKDVLGKVGWYVQNFNFAEINNTDKYADVSALVLDLASARLSTKEIDLLKKTIESLKNPGNESAMAIFQARALDDRDANFQLGSVTSSNDGPVVKLSANSFSATEEITDCLFFKLGSTSVKFRAATQTMSLNSDFYAQVRQAVREKLGNLPDEYIKDLKIN